MGFQDDGIMEHETRNNTPWKVVILFPYVI